MRRVVVTGLGAVTPLGVSVRSTWDAILAGTSGVGPITRFDAKDFSTTIAAEVKGFDPERFIDRKEIKRMDPFIHYAMAAAHMAMEDAGLVIDAALAPKAGVYMGSGLGGLSTLERYHQAYMEGGPRKISPFFITMLISNLAPGHIAMRYGAKGPNIATSTACAASSHAIGEGMHVIRSGVCDVVIAGGAEAIITPLSLASVDLLERVGVDAYKIASGDITWDELIRRSAQTGKPLVISTGMASLREVSHAVAIARLGGAPGVALLHCVSAYPVPPGSENLRAIVTLERAFRVPVGLSDHGADEFAVPLAVTLGASLYERHLVLEAGDGSIDAAVSSTPDRFAGLVRAAARASAALGTGEKACQRAEAVNLRASRRALCAARRLTAGRVVEAADIVALRPAVGLMPGRAAELIGRPLTRDVDEGWPFVEEDLGGQTETRL